LRQSILCIDAMQKTGRQIQVVPALQRVTHTERETNTRHKQNALIFKSESKSKKNNENKLKISDMHFSIFAHLLCAYVCVTSVAGQIPALRPKIGEVGYELHREENELMFCVLSNEEMAKCQAFAAATARDHLRSEKTFGSYYRPILCKKYFSHDECMRVVDENSMQHPNIMTVDAGEVSNLLTY
jgi:hypothetical protein